MSCGTAAGRGNTVGRGLKAVKTASKGAGEAGEEGLELNARYMEPVARVREMQ